MRKSGDLLFAVACAQHRTAVLDLLRLGQQHWSIPADHMGQQLRQGRLRVGLHGPATLHQHGAQCDSDPRMAGEGLGDAWLECLGLHRHLVGPGSAGLGWKTPA